MLFIKKIMIHGVILYYININQITNIFHSLIKKFCNDQDLKKILRYVKIEDKVRSLSSVILQKFISKKYLKIKLPYNKIVINNFKYGKPYIEYNKNILNYNLSHDDELVVIGYFDNKIIGIDIILKSRKINVNKKYIKNARDWTIFEAYYKYFGTGIDNFDDTNILRDDIITKEICVCNKQYIISIKK